jgi:hypothetical protein
MTSVNRLEKRKSLASASNRTTISRTAVCSHPAAPQNRFLLRVCCVLCVPAPCLFRASVSCEPVSVILEMETANSPRSVWTNTFTPGVHHSRALSYLGNRSLYCVTQYLGVLTEQPQLLGVLKQVPYWGRRSTEFALFYSFMELRMLRWLLECCGDS